jgi:hypothetical protein
LNFQRHHLQNLDERQLQTVQLLYQLLPISNIFDEKSGAVSRLDPVVVFDIEGHPVFIA